MSEARLMPVEIHEEPANFIITLEIPLAERDDILVAGTPHGFVIVAHPAGSRAGLYPGFERAIRLPSEVYPEAAEVRLNNGVLEVIAPKRMPGGVSFYRLPGAF